MNLESIVVFVLILGVLVAFHELGHFIAAKLSGMRIEEFAFGFGPRLVRLFKRQETEYTIHAVPLGGFVKITGMEPGEEDIPDGFQAQAIWKRALVIFSGPLFSFILAVLVFEFIGIVWGFEDGSKTLNRVRQVNPHSVASSIGLRAGDRILKVNGKTIRDGAEMVGIIHGSPGREVVLLVDRGGKLSTLKAEPRWQIDYLAATWSFMRGKGDQAVVEDVTKDSVAEKAGIKRDDVLVSFNGKPISDGAVLNAAIKDNDRREVALGLLRDKQAVTVHVTPPVRTVDFAGAKWYFPENQVGRIAAKSGPVDVADKLLSINGKKIETGEQLLAALRNARKVDVQIERRNIGKPLNLTLTPGHVTSTITDSMGLLGFMPQFAFVKMNFVDSIKEGWRETRGLVSLIFASLSPEKIGESVGGPILIARQTSITVELGPYYVVQLGAMLSLSLAIINLFPIPIFDGGHLVLLAIEAVRRRRLTRDQMQWFVMAGVAIIGVLVLTVVFSDINKIITGQVPQ